MGNPSEFGREIPMRAHQLLIDLYDNQNLPESDRKTGVKLKATFLLSVAMPIVSVPVERMAREKGYLGNQTFSKEISEAINSPDQVAESPFYAGSWRYHKLEKGDKFPALAEEFPRSIFDVLKLDDALKAAKELSAKCFCSNLRNALSHGSVFYLNELGESGEAIKVNRFAFVSTDRPVNPTALHIQTVTMEDFRTFLGKWVKWLQNPVANRKND